MEYVIGWLVFISFLVVVNNTTKKKPKKSAGDSLLVLKNNAVRSRLAERQVNRRGKQLAKNNKPKISLSKSKFPPIKENIQIDTCKRKPRYKQTDRISSHQENFMDELEVKSDKKVASVTNPKIFSPSYTEEAEVAKTEIVSAEDDNNSDKTIETNRYENPKITQISPKSTTKKIHLAEYGLGNKEDTEEEEDSQKTELITKRITKDSVANKQNPHQTLHRIPKDDILKEIFGESHQETHEHTQRIVPESQEFSQVTKQEVFEDPTVPDCETEIEAITKKIANHLTNPNFAETHDLATKDVFVFKNLDRTIENAKSTRTIENAENTYSIENAKNTYSIENAKNTYSIENTESTQEKPEDHSQPKTTSKVSFAFKVYQQDLLKTNSSLSLFPEKEVRFPDIPKKKGPAKKDDDWALFEELGLHDICDDLLDVQRIKHQINPEPLPPKQPKFTEPYLNLDSRPEPKKEKNSYPLKAPWKDTNANHNNTRNNNYALPGMTNHKPSSIADEFLDNVRETLKKYDDVVDIESILSDLDY